MKKTFLVLFLLAACIGEQKKPNIANLNKKPLPNKIVLIFDNPPENWKYLWENGKTYSHHGKYEISYVDKNLLQQFWSPDYVGFDTLIIEEKQIPVEINHKYEGLDNFNYLFHVGDTALFCYQNNMPSVQFVSSTQKKYDFAYDSLIRKKIISKKFPAELKLKYPDIFIMSQGIDMDKESWKKKLLIQAEYQLQRETEILDSLNQFHLLSNKKYLFYKNRLVFNKKHVLLNKGQLQYKELHELFAQNEPSLKFSFYRDFAEAVVQKFYVEHSELIRSSHGSTYNYRTVYDSIALSSLFPEKTKKYLLRNYLEKIITNFSVEDANTYYKKFNTKYNDSIIKNYLAQKYNLKDIMSNEMDLVDVDSNEVSFKKILQENKGKVLYIDYWASWCAPCRAAMPASHELRQKYKDKDIVFVYLALNDTEKLWKGAMEKDGLLGYNNSYLITNPKNSKMLNDLHIQTIPRYMIYDKSGKLVHKNAPGPGSEETIALLNQYLAE